MTTRPWPCSAISVSVKCLPSRAEDTRPPRPRRAPHDGRFWNHMGKRRLPQGNANPGANIGVRGTPMISRASGRAWLPMFLLSVAHGADLSSPTRSLPQSCDAVRTVAVAWPKQHHIGQPVMLTAVAKMMTTIALIYQGTDCVILRGDVSGGWIVNTFI